MFPRVSPRLLSAPHIGTVDTVYSILIRKQIFMTNSCLSIAESYFSFSNEKNITEISNMFTEKSTYSSNNRGLFLWRENIISMMVWFFADFETLHWEIASIEKIKTNIVECHFTFNGIKKSGENISQKWIEKIVVFEDKIQHIEVCYE